MASLSISLPVLGRLFRSDIKSPLRRELRDLTVPIFVETLLIMMLGAADTFMLSRHSDSSVAAVGLANQVITFCFLVFEVINLGTSVLCSQYLGARLKERMERVVGLSLTLNLAFGLIISIILALFPIQILKAMGLGAEMLDEGAGYMRLVGLFAFVQALSMTLSAALRSNNKAIYPMLVILVVNVLNIMGNYVLIFGKFGAPALGVMGSAISTVTARCVAMLLLFIVVFRTTVSRFPMEIFKAFPLGDFKNLMKIGLPSAGESLSYSCSQLVIAFFITSLGMEALAVRTYCVNIIMFTYLFCIAIAHGGAISIGHLVGAGKWAGAFLMGRYVMKIGTAITFTLAVICALSGHFIFTLLTENPEIIYLGTTILWIDVILEIGRPINIVYVNTLQSAGDVNYPFYVGLIFMWSIAVVMAYFVGITMGFGILGMWWMFTLDENVRGIVFVRRWDSKGWMHKGFVAN